MKAVVLTGGAKWFYGIATVVFLCGIGLLFTDFHGVGRYVAVVSLSCTISFAWCGGHFTRW